MNNQRQPQNMATAFGYPPQAIRSMIFMEVKDKVITFYHSELLATHEILFANYIKTAERTIRDRFPDYEFAVKALPAKEFEERNKGEREEDNRQFAVLQSNVLDIIRYAAKIHTSDIHIDTEIDHAKIRLRVNGRLIPFRRVSRKNGLEIISVIYNTLCEQGDAMYMATEPQDASFERQLLPEELSGIRVASGPAMNGPFMVLRLLYKENIKFLEGVNPLAELGYVEEQIKTLKFIMSQPSGIVFVAGPTGSGKSTTLKYIIQEIAQDPTINFVSIEDPPEYNIQNVRQIPVTTKSNDAEREKAYAKAIRMALRTDPDRIMIGEIRDTASADMAIQCAQTGHPVWTTIHANSSFAILDRMLARLIGEKYSEFQARSLLSDSSIVNGLIFQRLVPVLCPCCKIPAKDPKRMIGDLEYKSLIMSLGEQFQVKDTLSNAVNDTATIKATIEAIREYVFLCNNDPNHKCENPDCKGGIVKRQVVSELVYTTPSILNDAFTKSTGYAKRIWNNAHRNLTLQANARKLILAGLVDPSDAIYYIGPLEADLINREDNER